MNIDKYIRFEGGAIGITVILKRDNIIGFRVPNPLICLTNVILDSGAEVQLTGLSLDEAQEILDSYENKPEISGSELNAIHHLRMALYGLVKRYPCDIGDDCHCETCIAKHALTTTSGFVEAEKEE